MDVADQKYSCYCEQNSPSVPEIPSFHLLLLCVTTANPRIGDVLYPKLDSASKAKILSVSIAVFLCHLEGKDGTIVVLIVTRIIEGQ